MPSGATIGLSPAQKQEQKQAYMQLMQQQGAPPLPPRPNYVPGAPGQPGTINQPPVFDPYNLPGGRNVGQAQSPQPGATAGLPPSQQAQQQAAFAQNLQGLGSTGSTQLPVQNMATEPIANVNNIMNLPANNAGGQTPRAAVPQTGGGGNQPPQQPGNAFQANANQPNPFQAGLANSLAQLGYNPGYGAPKLEGGVPQGQVPFNQMPPYFRPPGTPSIEDLRNGGSFLNAPIYTPQQQTNFSNLQDLAAQRFANPEAGFGPIEDRARRQFSRNTIPSLAERFTAMGGGQRSSAFQESLGQAGADLESQLAQLRGQYGQQAEQQALQQMNLGLTPLYNQQYTEPFSSGQAAAQIAAPVMDAATKTFGPAVGTALGTLAGGGTLGAGAKAALGSALGLGKGASLGAIAAALAPLGLAAGVLGTLAYSLYDLFSEDDDRQPVNASIGLTPAQKADQRQRYAQLQQQQAQPAVNDVQANPTVPTATSNQPQTAPAVAAPQTAPNGMTQQVVPASNTQQSPDGMRQTVTPLEKTLPTQPVQFNPGPAQAPNPRDTGTQIVNARRTGEPNTIVRQDMARQKGTAYPTQVYFQNDPTTPVPVPEMNPTNMQAYQRQRYAEIMAQAQQEGVSIDDPAFQARITNEGNAARAAMGGLDPLIYNRIQSGQISPARGIAEQYAQSLGGRTIPQAAPRISNRRR